jgi:hypothetical protein
MPFRFLSHARDGVPTPSGVTSAVGSGRAPGTVIMTW